MGGLPEAAMHLHEVWLLLYSALCFGKDVPTNLPQQLALDTVHSVLRIYYLLVNLPLLVSYDFRGKRTSYRKQQVCPLQGRLACLQTVL